MYDEELKRHEMTKMCIDCPHSIRGDQMNDETDRDMLEALAQTNERHNCHNFPVLLCIGQRIGIYHRLEKFDA